jgi:arylsulfatase A-like enzyme
MINRLTSLCVHLFLLIGIQIFNPFTCFSQTVKNKPNIIVILIDDAGYADFGFMGSKDMKTPEIDLLAKSGIHFTDAHTSSTVCAPSRAGLITGRYQQRFGFECNGQDAQIKLDTSEIMLGAALKTSGYKTVAIGKWHLGSKKEYLPNNRGFDEFYGFLAGSRHYFYNDKENDSPNNIRSLRHNNTQIKFDGYLTDAFGDAAVNYIDKYKSEPFFMYLAFNAVHSPLEAKESCLDKFKNQPRQMLSAMTWSLDENVGKVMEKLKKEQLLENTLIFFLSDNGGATDNQSSVFPLKGFKGNEFEGGQRVPFVMSWKNHLPADIKSDKLISSLDIYATAVAIAGVDNKKLKPLDGVNLLPFTEGKTSLDAHNMLCWRKDEVAAVRMGDYKLIRLKDFGSVLYNVKLDLGETKDLSKIEVKTFNKLQNALTKWEADKMNPLWTEGPWTEINFGINKALMENKTPLKLKP